MNLKFTVIIFLMSLMTSCAGPMNPFGAIEPVKSSKDLSTEPIRSPSSYISTTDAVIDFLPGRQNWHSAINFRTRIHDHNGVGPRSKIKFFYNNKDITEQIQKYSIKKISKDQKTILYSLKNFRLTLDRENKISVAYQRDDHSAPLIKHYEEPKCPIDSVQKVKDHGRFKSKKITFKTIEKISLEEGINPSLLAGLIAQESGFNPLAVSWAKAIGLTQVTSLAETHVLKKFPHWPRYEDITEFSYPKVKSLILLGKINKENEWRLNEEMSIKGGIEYLRFVESYWSINSNKKMVEQVFPHHPEIFEEIVLASYNSGPFRVKKAIERRGKDWLNSNTLNEAKKYVKKVKSYCYHFSNSGESYAPFSVSSL
ncbi:MAG: hypothetical protein CME70_20545 [Halobacteriovorax sp.]|nr:hypothetical protein [Halobacteriovorax sp.]